MALKELDNIKYDSFIGAWFLENTSICDKIIKTFEDNSHLSFEGSVGVDGNIDHKFKKNKEMYLDKFGDLYKHYEFELQKVCEEYINKYKRCNYDSAWTIKDVIKIQKYQPCDGYYTWHCERGCKEGLMGSRHLVFLTYLNDVNDAGETEFYYQKLKVKPRKGLTLIWPVDWTHTHRGVTSSTETKYIVTGWYNYV